MAARSRARVVGSRETSPDSTPWRAARTASRITRARRARDESGAADSSPVSLSSTIVTRPAATCQPPATSSGERARCSCGTRSRASQLTSCSAESSWVSHALRRRARGTRMRASTAPRRPRTASNHQTQEGTSESSPASVWFASSAGEGRGRRVPRSRTGSESPPTGWPSPSEGRATSYARGGRECSIRSVSVAPPTRLRRRRSGTRRATRRPPSLRRCCASFLRYTVPHRGVSHVEVAGLS